ncbi:S49 family peptidase [Falsiroseomonas tokyonensis]|uniref:S49 family peptidase n=1 Tax=Falsiroseomonas tokyonensis TaxID=430521 RepID=A0ABV7BLZ3_9PROT|nr:S49 family peptidase [Falsiroseomonas tokyonensis]MBU8536233.1 S49 family peptidase [Falsiroseomonas tokyonensis]
MNLPFLSKPPRIAVLRLSGVIAARGASAFAAPGISAQTTGPLLDRAFGIKRLAELALVINSPGGSPVQSSLVAQRIRRLADQKKVKVTAYVEDAAASGGYWLACAADEIVADPASILGSIGVISAGFGLEEAIGRIGVRRRMHTAGSEKSFLDPFGPERPEDVARLEQLLAELHETFRDWVRRRRSARLKAPEAELFSGRFWSGKRAVELGLADRLGEVTAELRARHGEKAQLIPIGPRRPPWPLRLISGAALAEGAMAAVEDRAAWARLGL